MFRRLFLSTLLISVVCPFTFAQTTAPAPSVDKLREHVTYLASEKLEGRRTGTKGSDDAAKYIAGEYERLGLLPFPRNGKSADSYLQPFPFVTGVALGKGNTLSFGTSALRVGEDWMPLGFSVNTRFENIPAVFVAYGITADDLHSYDFVRASAADKVAISMITVAVDDNLHSRFVRFQ